MINALLKSEVSLVNRGDSIYVFCEKWKQICTYHKHNNRNLQDCFELMMVLHIRSYSKTDKGECTICMIPKLLEESLAKQLKNIQETIDNGIFQINKKY